MLVYNTPQQMFNDAAINLRELVSNNKEVNQFFNLTDRAEVGVTKILGHKLDITSDTLNLKPARN